MNKTGCFAWLLAVAFPVLAQHSGYEISGQDARLAGEKIYLLRPGRPLARQDSTLADAAGGFVLRGVVPAPDVYLLRVGNARQVQPVPLANQE